MTSEELHPAVELFSPPQQTQEAQFAKEKQAFWAMQTALLQHYEGQYVAIYQGQVVDSDLDKVALALRVYHKYGYVPIYVHHVSRHQPRTRYIHSPHLLMPH
jgi:hypothetical protein